MNLSTFPNIIVKTIHMLNLFDYIKVVFSKKDKEWKALTDLDKSRNFFMLNRFMSIKYPYQANYLSHIKINSVNVSDYWHRAMSQQFTTVPNWVYTKTIKKKEAEKKLDLPSDEMIKWYCNHHEMSRKDFEQQVKFFGGTFIKEVKDLEKTLKSQGII